MPDSKPPAGGSEMADLQRLMDDFEQMLRWTPPPAGVVPHRYSMPVLTLYPMLKPLPEIDCSPHLTLLLRGNGGGETPPNAAQTPVHPPADALADAPSALSDEDVTRYAAGLWNYLPPSPNEPEPAQEYKSGFVQMPGSRVTAARVRGKKHKHDGTNCDDWYEAAGLGDITMVAVSDGAGSRRFSRIGAKASCRAAIGYLAAHLRQVFSENRELRGDLCRELSDEKGIAACAVIANLVQDAMRQAYHAVETAYYMRMIQPAYAACLGRDLEIKDFEATLLLSVFFPVDEETVLTVSCGIGDGLIALLDRGGSYDASVKLMNTSDAGEYVGETEFLVSPAARSDASLQNRTRIYRGKADLAMLMTDGVADDYYPYQTQMQRLYLDLLLNGILDVPQDTGAQECGERLEELAKKLPEPLIYPWVNDKTLQVAVQYAGRVCESTGLTPRELWRMPPLLHRARMVPGGEKAGRDDRLKVWLDNYVARGSFDDRTLVLVEL